MAIEDYILQTKLSVSESLPEIFDRKRNLTKKEISSLKKLKHNKNETIKPADKNLGIVVLDTKDYINELMAQLTSTTYQSLTIFLPLSYRKNPARLQTTHRAVQQKTLQMVTTNTNS